MSSFEELGLSNQLLFAIKKLGFDTPTQIQEESIPHILNGLDVIGGSATGSGKTLAFGCGVVEHVVKGEGLQALILTPTRELADQVKETLAKLSHKKNLMTITVYGGVAINPQINDLKRAEVVVATPGRLKDHLQRGTIDLSRVHLLVLDEADRMLDMGFIEDVEDIMQSCPEDRQTLFFSATLPERVRDLAQRQLYDPIAISATPQVDPTKLHQVYYDVPKNMKLSLLVHLLQNESSGLVIVFSNTRKNTDFIVKNLRANRIDAVAIHGGLSQNKRTKTINMFTKAKAGVLVCTDVASRGIHIDNVSHVYNYEIPKDPKDYVHRIGRTARAGNEGMVINLICELDFNNFGRVFDEYPDFDIEKLKRPYLERIAPIRVDDSRGRRGGPGRGNFRGQGRNNRSQRRRGPRRY